MSRRSGTFRKGTEFRCKDEQEVSVLFSPMTCNVLLVFISTQALVKISYHHYPTLIHCFPTLDIFKNWIIIQIRENKDENDVLVGQPPGHRVDAERWRWVWTSTQRTALHHALFEGLCDMIIRWVSRNFTLETFMTVILIVICTL